LPFVAKLHPIHLTMKLYTSILALFSLFAAAKAER
jgi:hypothetical protein